MISQINMVFRKKTLVSILSKITDFIRKSIEKKHNRYVVFIDLMKAFDTVIDDILSENLQILGFAENMGICLRTTSLLKTLIFKMAQFFHH